MHAEDRVSVSRLYIFGRTKMNITSKHTPVLNRLLTGAALMALVLATAAQAGAHTASNEDRMDRLADKLDLSAEQRPQVEAILAESSKKRRAAFTKSFRDMNDAEREAVGDEMAAIRKENDAAMVKVLTTRQLAKYEDLREERLEMFRDTRKRYVARRDKGMEKLADKLDLTDGQRPQVEAILAEARTKRWAAMNIERPFPELSDEEREALADEMTAIREETDVALDDVLTREQIAKLDELREERLEGLRKIRLGMMEDR